MTLSQCKTAPISGRVAAMQSVIEAGRVLRDRNTLPIKYPLKEVVVVDSDDTLLAGATSLESYIVSELNVRKLTVSSDKQKCDVKLTVKPNHMLLGKRLRKDFKPVSAAIATLTDAELSEMKECSSWNMLGHTIQFDELYTAYEVTSDTGSYAATSLNNILILLDCNTDQDMMEEGQAREVVNRVQKLRKKAHLVPTGKITVYYKVDNESDDFVKVLGKYNGFIETAIKSKFHETPATSDVMISEKVDVKGCKFTLTLCGSVSREATSVAAPQWPEGRLEGSYLSVKCNYLRCNQSGHDITLQI